MQGLQSIGFYAENLQDQLEVFGFKDALCLSLARSGVHVSTLFLDIHPAGVTSIVFFYRDQKRHYI